METELGVVLPQARGCLGLAKAGRGKEDPSLQVSWEHGHGDSVSSDFWPPKL